MKLFLCSILLLGHFSLASANTENYKQNNLRLLLRSPQTHKFVYEQYLIHNPQFTDPVSHFENARHNSAQLLQLKKLMATAEDDFLENTFANAKISYLKIVDLAYAEDWPRVARQLFIQAYFRLAQIDVHFQHKWIQQAVIFDEQIMPDQELFPPPLIKKWQTQKDNKKTMPWSARHWLANYSTVYLNGRKQNVDLDSSIHLSPANNRLSFVSSAYKTVTLKGDLQKIMSHPLVTRPYIQGTCSKAKFTSGLENTTALFPHDCLVHQPIRNPLLTQPEAPLQTTFSVKKTNWTQQKELPIISATKTTPASPSNRTTWYKKKWLWFLVAGIGAVKLYDLNQQERHSTVPSHRSDN